jgi:DNA adenine methylase
VTSARPFAKWAGGKTQLLPELRKYEPETFGVYSEPFVGAGALFWDLAARGRIRTAMLADTNELLVMTYRVIRDRLGQLLERLHEHETAYKSTDDQTKRLDYYLSLRDAMGTPGHWGDPVDEAARFIATNKTGFNGLFRVNGSGKFNVPFGRYTNPQISDDDNLRACSVVLAETDINCEDFAEAMGFAESGDFCYCDPPYVPVSATGNFTSYTAGGFSMADQIRLRDAALACRERGVHVILSNADLPIVRELYKDFTVHAVQAKRNINSNAGGRGPVGELIIT